MASFPRVMGIAAFTLLASRLLAFPVSIAAQGVRSPRRDDPISLPRISGTIQIDGRVEEAAWEAIDPLPVTMQVPTLGGAPTEKTEFRVGYDDRYLYFSCRAWDSDPDGIRATSLQRDDGTFSNDWCVINLDTFDDKETALVFGTSPAGIRTDVVFMNDATTAPNFSWNTFWDAAVSRDESGWYAEIRIPFSSIRFQRPDTAGRVIMGLALWRLLARKNELVSFPAISPQWGTYSIFKASQFQDVALKGIEPARPVYLTPYALGGLGKSHELNEDGSAYLATDDRVREVGLDMKAGLASNLTLDLTFNTDFAQVEADDQQVNLTRFSLFFPEKRLFFQERSAVFEYSLGGDERLFHSRRIGLVEGEQVPLYAGARLVGRMGEWDVGLLDMQSGKAADNPGENLGVLRLRRRILNENSYLGGILTSRVAGGGGSNVVYGLDGLIRLFGQDYLTLDWAQAFDHPGESDPPVVDPPPGFLGRSLGRVLWERRGQDGLTYAFDATRAGGAFEPGLGYLRRRDFSAYGAQVGYGWRPGEASRLLRHTLTVPARVYTRNEGNSIETVEITPMWDIELKSSRIITPSITWTYENLDEGFDVGDATVPAGEHRFATFRLEHTHPNSSLFGFNAWVEAGGYYDGRKASFSVSPIWRSSRNLTLTGTYRLDDIRFDERNESFRAHIGRLRIQVTATTRLSAAALVQYNSSTDLVSTNIRLRYNPSEGHDLYLVWNQGINTDREGYDPVRPFTDQRTLLVKYSRTFTLGF